jgi:hypothetical protein
MASETSTTVAAPQQAKLLPLYSPPRPKRSPPLHYEPGEPAKGLMGFLHVLSAYKFLLFMSAVYYLMVALYLLLAYWLITRQWLKSGLLIGAMAVESQIPMPKYYQDPRGMKNWLLRELARIFDYRMVMTERLNPDRPHLIAQYPHGEWPGLCMSYQVTWCAF